MRAAGEIQLCYRRNGLPFARLAQVVPKRLAARAVDRSRLRRVLREVFRLSQGGWSGYDCVFKLRSAYTPERDFGQLARAVLAPGP